MPNSLGQANHPDALRWAIVAVSQVRLSLPILGLALVACGPAEETISTPVSDEIGEVGRRESAIINGQVDIGHPAVGVLLHGNSLCTATLIGSRTYLTAGHCLVSSSPRSLKLGGVSHAVSQEVRHPGFTCFPSNSNCTTMNNNTSNDVAVGFLTEPVLGIRPAQLATSPPAVGQWITMVGFGATYENPTTQQTVGVGTKRFARNTISSVESKTIVIRGVSDTVGVSCRGDSGGPMFRTDNGVEVQVGISSTGSCIDLSNYVRVDSYYDWVRQWAGTDLGVVGDNQSPTVTVLSPTPGAKTGVSLEVEARAEDQLDAIQRLQLSLDGQVVPDVEPDVLGSRRQETLHHALSGLSPGPHTLRVEAWDRAGNSGAREVDFVALGEGSLSSECQSSYDCASGLCAFDAKVYARRCAQECGSANPCPDGFECDAGAERPLCVARQYEESPGLGPDKSSNALIGGCELGGASSEASSAIVSILMLLGLRQQEKHARRRSRCRKVPRPALPCVFPSSCLLVATTRVTCRHLTSSATLGRGARLSASGEGVASGRVSSRRPPGSLLLGTQRASAAQVRKPRWIAARQAPHPSLAPPASYLHSPRNKANLKKGHAMRSRSRIGLMTIVLLGVGCDRMVPLLAAGDAGTNLDGLAADIGGSTDAEVVVVSDGGVSADGKQALDHSLSKDTTTSPPASLLDKINVECAALKVAEPAWLWQPAKVVQVAAKDASAAFKASAQYKCDGSGDQSEIQAAIAAAGSGGKVVLSEGNFYFSGSVNVDRKLLLQGQGSAKTTVHMGGLNVKSEYVQVKGFRVLKGSGTLKVFNSHVSVRDVVMEGIDSNGIGAFYLWGGTGLIQDIELVECKAIDCKRYGFINSSEKTSNSVAGKGMKDIRVTKCESINSGKAGCISTGPWCPGFDILEQGNIVDSQYVCCKASGSQESGFHEESGKPPGGKPRLLSNILIKNCISVDNAQKGKSAAWFGAGFTVGTGTRLENCYSSNNKRGFLMAGGGSTMVQDVSCINCEDHGSDVGFFLGSGNNFTLQDCTSNNAASQALTVSRLWDSTIKRFKAVSPKGGTSDGSSIKTCVKFAPSVDLLGLENIFAGTPYDHDINVDLQLCGCGAQTSLYVSKATNLVFTGEVKSQHTNPLSISGTSIDTKGLKVTIGGC